MARLAEGVERVLAAHGLASEGLQPKSWQLFVLPHAPVPDVVVGLSAAALGATLRVWPTHARLLDWHVGPHTTRLVGRDALRAAFHELRRRINLALEEGAFRPVGLRQIS